MSARRTAFVTDSLTVIVSVMRLLDVAVVAAFGYAAYVVRHGALDPTVEYHIGIVAGALLMANYGHILGLYRVRDLRPLSAQLGATLAAWGLVAATLLVLAYLTKYSENFSRLWAVLWVGATPVALMALRALWANRIARWVRRGELSYNVVVVGAGAHGRRLVQYLHRRRDMGVRLLGLFDDRGERVPEEVEGYRRLGTVDDLLRFVARNRVDEIVIALPWRSGPYLKALVRKLETVAADVKLCPEMFSFDLPNLGYGEIAGLPMLKVHERPLSGWNLLLKAIEDRVLAAVFLAAFSPLLLVIALAIRLDSRGPVFFRQTRYGFNNDEFKVLKFRTMQLDAGDDPNAPQARRNDPRVTRVGALLRRTSLDELPQLFNVLRGEMSLVGPRPHAVAHNEQYAALIDGYLGRHRVKPGITGWAQVNGLRGEVQTDGDMRRRVRYDIFYIQHWSLLLDLRILVMTLFVGFVHKNAY